MPASRLRHRSRSVRRSPRRTPGPPPVPDDGTFDLRQGGSRICCRGTIDPADMAGRTVSSLGFLEVANRTAIASEEVHAWAQEGIIEYVPPVKDVRPFIADADFVVLPSYYREGLSRALLEAAAMGRPIVTTDWPGCREVVTDGVNGYLCTPRDIDSLTTALERAAMTDDAQWLAMSRAGREKAAEEFSQQRVIDLYLKALAEAGISP